MARVLTDFHHSSLLRATNLLFGDRLGMEVYRPIGMDWFHEGFWAINDQEDTARQYLEIGSQPLDKTPALNEADDMPIESADWFDVHDPGNNSTHRAATLRFFKRAEFDYVIASIPAHVGLFERLIAKYNPNAKLIVQVGNEWPPELFAGYNVLASIKPRDFPKANVQFYHQEFDLDIFQPAPMPTQPINRKVYSFINCLEQQMPLAWSDFTGLEFTLGARSGFKFKTFGGQCRDGNMNGPHELADKMREAMFIFHVKEGGDGFGHILYNAYAVGRPVITRRRFYKDRLGEELFAPGTYIDLDEHNLPEAFNILNRLANSPVQLIEMGKAASARFREVVHYEREAREIRSWLEQL
jgi:hypothetical protein